VAARQKKARDLNATLAFTDESGFLLMPLLRRTLARCGHTPVLRHRAHQRDKVSVAAALTLSPARGHVSLYYQTYPDAHVDVEVYAAFVHALLRQVRNPLVLVHDRGNMHRGEAMRALGGRFPRRLDVNLLPPYAPELNPVEYLWTHSKGEELANFAPPDVPRLERAVVACMEDVRRDQHRLRSFFAESPLPWDGLTVFF
jgi:transposase